MPDVIVVGAGAAGLMAAQCAAAGGCSTVLLEKQATPGLKILISGGGRCNLTTTRQGRLLETEYGARRGRFLRHALRQFPPPALCAMVESAGVRLHEEDLDKIFPVSRRARDVLDACVRLCRDAGAELRLEHPVRAARALPDGGFAVTTPHGELSCRALILATGGRSYPKTGATGDGYGLLAAFGHHVTRTLPALAPLRVDAAWVHDLQGIVLHGVELSLCAADGALRNRRRRPILFTHQGLSGPAPMDLAGDVEECGAGAALRFDFVPGLSRDLLEAQWLDQARAHGRSKVETLLPQHLPERVRSTLCQLAGVAGTLAELSKDGRRRLLDTIKQLSLPVDGTRGFAHAEVTRGGVELDEIDAATMQSRLLPGLFVCGELLDVDGPIGGFNFQAAFATGRLAGRSAAAHAANPPPPR